MENPEEVLQALDEFEKMRPSEIPRELEEYLSWVAKTGDPVYQWSLVKPLFREKLTRVMTDFYESCPSLELAACPNVEQFNYDIMKCNLLELLESFCNAPFTVQRICELLTSPRKEYNRVDKFMRAIEKNILVVSTTEPGPAARRSENGDGMVNGSMEEDTPTGQARRVDADTWVKDCAPERPAETAVPEAGKPKAITEDTALDKNQESSEDTPVRSREVESEEDHTQTAVPRVEDSPENGASIQSAVPEAVINEDTSSQPGLESPNGQDSATKLRTSFRKKDFSEPEEDADATSTDSADGEAEKKKTEDSTNENKDVAMTQCENMEATSLSSSSEQVKKIPFECEESEISLGPEGLPEKRARVDEPIAEQESVEPSNPISEEDDTTSSSSSSCSSKKDSPANKTEEEERYATSESSAQPETKCQEAAEEVEKTEEAKKESEPTEIEEVEEDPLPEADRTSETIDNPKPIVEEPGAEDLGTECDEAAADMRQRESGVTIEEAMDDDTKTNTSIIPDPIPIVEEPKDPEPSASSPSDPTTIITELPEMGESSSADEATTVEADVVVEDVEAGTSLKTIDEEISDIPQMSQEETADVVCPEKIDDKIEPAESMEVDGEESLSTFQQDEPMEEEPAEMVKS